MDIPHIADALRGAYVTPTYNVTVGLTVPICVAIALAAYLATVHRYVVDPSEDSKRRRVPKRRHVILAPSSWEDRRTLYTTPRAFECWVKLARDSRGGVVVGTMGDMTTRAINFEISRLGRPRLVWHSRSFAYEWEAETDVRKGEWVHVAITFSSNSTMDMLLCFVDGAEVDHVEMEEVLPQTVPELAALVGRDHTHDPSRSLDGELALVRLWSCVLPDEIIESHVDGSNRIYPVLTDDEKTKAGKELEQRRLDADSTPFHNKHLLAHFRTHWPDEVELRAAPVSVDCWMRLPLGGGGGVVTSSAPASGSFTVQILRDTGRAKMTWYARTDFVEGGVHTDASARDVASRPMFDLTLSEDVRTDAWVHLAFVYAKDRDVLLGFVNGALAGEARRLVGSGNEPPDVPAGPVLYGRDAVQVAPDAPTWFDGDLSHVRIWASELRASAIGSHARGRPVLAALHVTPQDATIAADQRTSRDQELEAALAEARAEADEEAARREEAAALARRKAEEHMRMSKRQAAEAQIKVASFMSGRRVEFSETAANSSRVEEAWNVDHIDHSAANREVLSGLAQVMAQFPDATLEVHAKTGAFAGGSGTRALQSLGRTFGVDGRTYPKAVAEELAHRRAEAVRDALMRAGMPESRVQVKWTGLTGGAEVTFLPKPLKEDGLKDEGFF